MARYLGIAALILCVGVGQTSGAIIFRDTFDAENGGGGGSVLNYASFANWTVDSGAVDLVRDGDWGLPGDGLFIDLDGSSDTAGILLSKKFVLGPGTYCVSYDLAGAGSHRTAGPDGVCVNLLNALTSGRVIELPSTAEYSTFSDVFTLTSTKDVRIQFVALGAINSGDQMGLLLDNVTLASVESAVPEPTTLLVWSMLGVFGLAARHYRQRRITA